MNEITNRRRTIVGPSGEVLIYDNKTGTFYPEILDITMIDSPSGDVFTRKYSFAQFLKEATIRGFKKIGRGGNGGESFSNCPILEKLSFPDGLSVVGNTYIARNCPKLYEITIGSIDHPTNTTLYYRAFDSSGTSATNPKTITLYVPDNTTLPLANAPWGLTGATVIYRSSTTGEILEVPTE